MAAKKSAKKTAKKTSAKKTAKKAAAKPKKVAKQVVAKAPKAPKAPKAASKKPRSETPTSGQSGPPLELVKGKLNKKEDRVVSVLLEDANPVPINALATNCFSDQTSSMANSWVRNSLRRLVRAKWVEKVGKGTYRLTEKGREWATGASAPVEAPVEAPAASPVASPSPAPAPEAAQPSA